MELTKPTENWNNPNYTQENKKIAAGVLALLVGYLGYTSEGIIQLLLTVCTCGIAGIIPFVEGIIYLTMNENDFYQTYQVGKKGWF